MSLCSKNSISHSLTTVANIMETPEYQAFFDRYFQDEIDAKLMFRLCQSYRKMRLHGLPRDTALSLLQTWLQDHRTRQVILGLTSLTPSSTLPTLAQSSSSAL